jgi:hypothetical protein
LPSALELEELPHPVDEGCGYDQDKGQVGAISQGWENLKGEL